LLQAVQPGDNPGAAAGGPWDRHAGMVPARSANASSVPDEASHDARRARSADTSPLARDAEEDVMTSMDAGQVGRGGRL